MLYRCDSCGASMTYDPDNKALVCDQCKRSQTVMPASAVSMKDECPTCGAPFEGAEKSLVYHCPYCGSWSSVDKNLSAADAPARITPFSFGKRAARQKIKEAFDRIPFLPDSFLKDPDGKDIEALYAPFWLYRVNGSGNYDYEGEKQKSHKTGSTTFTDHDVYKIHRAVRAVYEAVPVDAMDSLDDETIDAALPYDSALSQDMNPIYLPGTNACLPDMDLTEPEYIDRAEKRAMESMNMREKELFSSYEMLKKKSGASEVKAEAGSEAGVLLPVYRYEYKGFGSHKIYMNGCSGRMSGDAPCDKGKVIFHFVTEAVCVLISAAAVAGILGTLI